LQRHTALLKGMQFHRVPRAYQAPVADVVAKLMLAMLDTWNYDGGQLPQPRAMTCTYVVYAIAERVKAAAGGFAVVDGSHRLHGLTKH
jgi:hypothetical protein